MTEMTAVDRRQFLRTGAVVAAGIACQPLSTALAQSGGPTRPKICAFTKFLQDLSYNELAKTIKELGFDGVEATVRKGGHVEPERVADDLPKMVEALRNQDVEIVAMATDVCAADPLSEKVLRTAVGLGVPWYRMGFYQYDPHRPILKQLDELRPQVGELAELNRELGVQGLYQNHSDAKYVGATLWDLHYVIRDLPAADIGSAFDIRHATIEAGLSWPVLFKLMRPHVGAVFVKDFQWKGKKAEHVPLGTGRVDPKFFDLLRESEFAGPFSLHVEYVGTKGPQPNIEALRRDLNVLQGWLAG